MIHSDHTYPRVVAKTNTLHNKQIHNFIHRKAIYLSFYFKVYNYATSPIKLREFTMSKEYESDLEVGHIFFCVFDIFPN